ncbi:DUF4132 domain-containing protein [Microbispora rosea]|uniref:DUF4132 domain-containing protein n=1 Tax=Microbispora rosea TaxID=58117 RepID=UPI003D94B0EE
MPALRYVNAAGKTVKSLPKDLRAELSDLRAILKELAGHRPAPDAVAGLWHPIHATADEVSAWRDHLLESGVRQPFKQVFRELYLLTPAEERTGTFCNRFAGHILRYGQARTLLGQRGWTGRSIGNWDYENGGDQGEVTRELAGWQARWAMHIVSAPRAETPMLCATEGITFHRDGQPAAPPSASTSSSRTLDPQLKPSTTRHWR